LLGFLFNATLYGVLSAQTYYYHLHFPKDTTAMKAFVYGLFVWETIQTALCFHDAFYLLGGGWGDLEKLTDLATIWFNTPVMSGTISISVQLFFTRRIYVLTKSRVLSLCIGLV
ncbi:hypothetical protein GYMLUDRAFT_160220, partial [Collybiopsis luxurians FD-317 M1]